MISVNTRTTIASGLEFVENYEPDLILISDSLSGSVPDFCERLRVLTYNTRPVIVVMSKSSDINDKIEYGYIQLALAKGIIARKEDYVELHNQLIISEKLLEKIYTYIEPITKNAREDN